MMKTTLSNDFHGTSVSVRVPADGILSQSQYRRVCRALCGISECRCGTVRGQQQVAVEDWQDTRTGRYSYRIRSA